jgi:DNA-binding transcriptional LysR family regulator
MDRLLRLEAFWSWLPAFRAVGETEHLPSAAAALHVSASALSRSIGLLERRLGYALFERGGRALRLTPAGREFLASVRTAMRQLDDAVDALERREPHGALRIASVTAVATEIIAPAVKRLCRRFPALRPELTTRTENVAQRLLAGELDLAFVHAPAEARGLLREPLAALPRAVYCGPEHPLARRRRVHVRDLAKFAFVTSLPDARGVVADGWPAEWRRTIAVQVDSLLLGYELCLQNEHVAVLPDLLANHLGRALHRVPLAGCQPVELHALRRTGGDATRADALLVAAVARRCQQLQLPRLGQRSGASR